jgi:hypothetical protein
MKGREVAGATGLEPAASCVTGRRSNQLNYAPTLNYPKSLYFPFPTASSQAFPKFLENAVTAMKPVVSDWKPVTRVAPKVGFGAKWTKLDHEGKSKIFASA